MPTRLSNVIHTPVFISYVEGVQVNSSLWYTLRSHQSNLKKIATKRSPCWEEYFDMNYKRLFILEQTIIPTSSSTQWFSFVLNLLHHTLSHVTPRLRNAGPQSLWLKCMDPATSDFKETPRSPPIQVTHSFSSVSTCTNLREKAMQLQLPQVLSWYHNSERTSSSWWTQWANLFSLCQSPILFRCYRYKWGKSRFSKQVVVDCVTCFTCHDVPMVKYDYSFTDVKQEWKGHGRRASIRSNNEF